MFRDQLNNEIRLADLGRIAGDIEKLAKIAIRLDSSPGWEQQSPAGSTHLGGVPDLPTGTAWPLWKGKLMSFVAQVNLADTSPYDPDRLLPERGLLSFFYDSAQETYGADPEDRGGWQVLYFSSSPAHLHQVPFPASLPAEARFHPCSLHFSAELTLPSAPMQINPNLHWTQEETQRYEQMQQAFPIPKGNSPYRNRMLGYPDQLQDDMQLQAALISQGLHTIDDPGAAQAAAHKSDWILLLQLDSDANAGMRWGSAGLIDYWIKNQDLKTRKFNDTWLIMQSD